MFRVFSDRHSGVDLAPRILKVQSIKDRTTEVTLVSASTASATQRTVSFDEAICQKREMLVAVQLLRQSLLQEAVSLQFQKDVLSDLGVFVCSGTAEDVKADVEPPIDICMDRMILVTKLLWCDFLEESSGFCSSPVLVGT